MPNNKYRNSFQPNITFYWAYKHNTPSLFLFTSFTFSIPQFAVEKRNAHNDCTVEAWISFEKQQKKMIKSEVHKDAKEKVNRFCWNVEKWGKSEMKLKAFSWAIEN